VQFIISVAMPYTPPLQAIGNHSESLFLPHPALPPVPLCGCSALPLVIRTQALAMNAQRYSGFGIGNFAVIERSFALSRVSNLSVLTRRSVSIRWGPK